MTKGLLALSSFPSRLLEALIIIATFPVGHQPQPNSWPYHQHPVPVVSLPTWLYYALTA